MVQDDAAPGPANAEAADAKIGQYLDGAAAAMAMSFLAMQSLNETVDAPSDEDSPEDKVARAELLSRMRAAVEDLSEQEKKLVQRYYFEDKTLLEVGTELGLSKSWTCRLHARAIEAISKRLRERED
jgi:RNA polymerase sigma factor (sigma-70 family)